MMRPSSVQAKRVIVCADDFAVHVGASEGIAALARAGRISATSVMVLSPRWPQDVALLQDLPHPIDVGLHLDWTSEFAIAAGHGMTLYAAMLKAALGGFGRGGAAAQTRAVIERQLDAFEAQWRAPPDYVDGHQHVQQFAGVREALVQALVQRYGSGAGRKPYLRVSRAPAGSVDLKSRVIAAMGAPVLERLAADAGLPVAAALLGVYDFAGDQNRYSEWMAAWLQAAPEGCIIMCHPAQDAPAQDAIGAARQREFAYLGSEQFAAALERAGVQVVRGTCVDR